jgi:hypothetical protein
MTSTLYVDVHVPLAVTAGLRRRGLDVLTSQEDGTTREAEEDLLSRAAELGRTLLTQDQDFLRITAAWQRQGRDFPECCSRLKSGSASAAWSTTLSCF